MTATFWPSLLKILILFLCVILCLYEFSHIIIKTIQGDSFQSINELHFEELYAPVLTLCPAVAWKKPAPFINSFTEFQNATFSWEEIFHPETLKILRNKSRFHILRILISSSISSTYFSFVDSSVIKFFAIF